MPIPLRSISDNNIPANTPIESIERVLYNENENSSDGGGGSMNNDYVTHPELKVTELNLQNKIDKLDAKIEGRFNIIDEKFNVIDEKFHIIDEKFNSLNIKIDNLTKLVWWIMGLIGAGLIIPLLAFALKAIFK